MEIELMECVVCGCVGQMILFFVVDKCIVVVCGSGNNGGDGLVIGCQFCEVGYVVMIFQDNGNYLFVIEL